MVRPTNEDSANEEDPSNQAQDQFTVAVGQDQTKTPYPEQVQAILNDYTDVFPRDLPAGFTAAEGYRSPYRFGAGSRTTPQGPLQNVAKGVG